MIASVREVTVIASAIGPHVPNLGAVVTLFGVDGLLLFFMVFHYKSMFRSCGPDGSLGPWWVL